MRVVLDSNVMIAAFAARGLCAEIFEVCLSNHTILISGPILLEIQKNLRKKIHLPEEVIQNIGGYLRDIAEIVEPENIESVCRDKSDDLVLGTALKGGARYLITGDSDLLILKNYKGVEIITPRAFWHLLRR